MSKRFVLISKDAMCCEYLPAYGNKYWRGKTPNIDALVSKGTVFTNYYTAAPSSVMSFFSMATGLFAHKTEYELYERKHYRYYGDTIFTKVKKIGFDECHLLWDAAWSTLSDYFDYFRDDVQIHNIKDLRQGVGPHYIHDGDLQPDAVKAQKTFDMMEEIVKSILCCEKSIFLWFHLPHVINGRVAYGSDIDLFDKYIGMVRKYVPDDCIAFTADHGNMNGHKGKLGYGHDVYNASIKIPLIIPRINGKRVYSDNASSVDLFNILFERMVPQREFIYSDSAYKAQKNRKLAIIKGHYKYIYNKRTDTEELYDLEYDPNENFSIMEDKLFDIDRKIWMPIKEEYFYLDWDEVYKIRKILQAEKNRIWRNGTTSVVLKSNLKDFLRPIYEKLNRVKVKK